MLSNSSNPSTVNFSEAKSVISLSSMGNTSLRISHVTFLGAIPFSSRNFNTFSLNSTRAFDEKYNCGVLEARLRMETLVLLDNSITLTNEDILCSPSIIKRLSSVSSILL